MLTDELYWYWINNIEGIGTATLYALLEVYKSPDVIYHLDPVKILSYLKKSSQLDLFIQSQNVDRIKRGYDRLLQQNIQFISPLSPCYPEGFQTLKCPPLGLYLKGRFPSNQKTVAIIGARNCTRYGKEMARYFGKRLAENGIGIVSGLARGIDAMAHRGALEGSGYTIGILGCGIDGVYPKENFALFMEMEKCGGILSEYNIGVPPHAGLFPLRNRLIAGLVDGILVVEAMERSGTFITVDEGLSLGKDIFAMPGRITDEKSMGCNNLIKLGAHVVTSVEDILDVLQIEGVKEQDSMEDLAYFKKVNEISLAPLEKIVYSCLQIEPQYVDDIIEKSKIAPQEVCMVLNKLSICGMIEETDRNYFAIRI